MLTAGSHAMQNNAIEVAVDLKMSLGESPLWSVKRQTLYWADINYGHVYSWQPLSGGPPQQLKLGEKVGCIALCEDGLLAATSSGILRLRMPFAGKPEQLAVNSEWKRGNRFN